MNFTPPQFPPYSNGTVTIEPAWLSTIHFAGRLRARDREKYSKTLIPLPSNRQFNYSAQL